MHVTFFHFNKVTKDCKILIFKVVFSVFHLNLSAKDFFKMARIGNQLLPVTFFGQLCLKICPILLPLLIIMVKDILK